MLYKQNSYAVLSPAKTHIINLGLNRYVTAGAAWLNGAFGKVAKVGQVAGTKTREKWNMAVSNLTAKVGSFGVSL